jgi:hypothetical protein
MTTVHMMTGVAEPFPFGNCARRSRSLYHSYNLETGLARTTQKTKVSTIMTDAFQDREKGFERKYELDQDQEFRVQARRDKLFGHWLAQRFGMSGEAEEAYVIDVVDSNFEIPGDEDMLDKVKADIAAKGVSIEDAELNAKLSECMAEAHKQVIEGA